MIINVFCSYKKIITFLVILFLPSLSKAFVQDQAKIKVMSYNIQTGTHYQPDTPQKIAKLLDEWNVDIFGTQELHMPQVQLFAQELSDYDWFGVGRDNGKTLGETSVIFYRTEKYELLEQNSFWLSETPEVPGSKSWGTSDTRIVTWGKFLIKSVNKVFFVFNTHYDHISSLARSESSKLLRLKIREIADLNPIIITGDFNCSTGSDPYNILIEGHPNDLELYDSEKISITDPFGPSGSYNGFNNDFPTRRIDFVFINQYLQTIDCGIISEKPDGEFISDHFPVFVELQFDYPSPPRTPTLHAVSGDKKVNLYWDKVAEDSTYESFIVNGNDFQGYKLYRSRDPEMSEAELVAGSWNIPMLRKSLLVSDIIDGISGHTNYGIIDGYGYYLGDDTGLQHHYSDYDVENGVSYYYVLTAFDKGYSEVGKGIAPSENSFEFNFDLNDSLVYKSKNTVLITPFRPKDNSIIPAADIDSSTQVVGNIGISSSVFNPKKVREAQSFKLKFSVDTLGYLERNRKYRHPNDLLYLNNGFKVLRSKDDSLVYEENVSSFSGSNIKYDKTDSYFYLNTEFPVVTEEFEGIQLFFNFNSRFSKYSQEESGWINGEANIKVLPSLRESQYFPWQYEIVFTDNDSIYTGITNKVKGIRSHDDNPIGPASLLLNEKFNFYVINKSFLNNDSTYEKLDIIIYDTDMNGSFDRTIDQILVGHCVTLANQILWSGTVFAIDFSGVKDSISMPKPGDKYLLDFDRPYMETDEIMIQVDPQGETVKNINTIPNDYVLKQNYPNPFNPETTIEFSTIQNGNYSIKIYNVLGQLITTVFNKNIGAGNHSVRFNSAGLASGVYVYRLEGSGANISMKMMILK